MRDRASEAGPPPADESAARRRQIYLLLIVAACATLTARICQVESSSGRTPFLSANDRSRWATIRALVDHGTFALDEVIYRDGGRRSLEAALDPSLDAIQMRDPDWYSIDLVRHRGRDGAEHAYSSKPPLLSVLLAGEYWVVRHLTGATLGEQPFYVGRMMLILSNVIPLALAWWLLSRMVERLGTTDWGRLLVMAAATWGTLLSPMAVTLNNHLPAAICLTMLLAVLVRIADASAPTPRWFIAAGVTAGLAATMEIPALSAVALAGVVLAMRHTRQVVLYFLPSLGMVGVIAVALNFWAHGSWKPAYAHRRDGPPAVQGELPSDVVLRDGPLAESLRQQLGAFGITISPGSVIHATDSSRWRVWDPTSQRRWALWTDDRRFELRGWENWYEYEGSYWTPERLRGVDRGEPSRLTYALHVLVGHHGIFSLTPFWILSLIGAGLAFRRHDRQLRGLAGAAALLTLVCLTFYLARPLIDRNYGGVSCGFRWLFWLIPLWLLSAIPAADWASQRQGRRIVGLTLLAISIFSAQWSATSPWSHPWLFEYWTNLGWIAY